MGLSCTCPLIARTVLTGITVQDVGCCDRGVPESCAVAPQGAARVLGKPRPASKAERPAPRTGASLAAETAALNTALAQAGITAPARSLPSLWRLCRDR